MVKRFDKFFPSDYLFNNLGLPWDSRYIISDNEVSRSKWSTIHELVFKDKDNSTYKMFYLVEECNLHGATLLNSFGKSGIGVICVTGDRDGGYCC